MARGRRNADEALLAALACGATVENAARTVGISARTAHRRLKEEGFQKRASGRARRHAATDRWHAHRIRHGGEQDVDFAP